MRKFKYWLNKAVRKVAVAGNAAGAGHPSADLSHFFVSGVQKSGTNWICDICATHPQVKTVGELHLEHIRRCLREHAKKKFVPLEQDYMEQLFLGLARDILRKKSEEKNAIHGKYWVGDHSPGLCFRILPGAPRIAVIRDPRDVLVSAAFHRVRTGNFSPEILADMEPHVAAWKQDKWYFHKNPEKLVHPWLSEEVAKRWLKTVSYALNESRTCTDGTLMLVQYEEVHKDVNLWRERMLFFIGADPSALSPLKPGDRAYPLIKEDPGEFRRKGQVGDWRNYQSPDMLSGFKPEHRELMAELGYR